mmetsp:Transcript_13644/g.32544  ORF Transcript_13644/g.32544 Transcript_13644/m.32544 type:complete len:98 (+) Transcript_13644:728-1021(+)
MPLDDRTASGEPCLDGENDLGAGWPPGIALTCIGDTHRIGTGDIARRSSWYPDGGKPPRNVETERAYLETGAGFITKGVAGTANTAGRPTSPLAGAI